MRLFRFETPLGPEALAALHCALLEQPGRVTMIAEGPRAKITLAGLLEWIAHETRLSVDTIRSGKSAPSIRRARAAAAWGARVLLDSDLEAIAAVFGRRSDGGGRGLVAYAERLRGNDEGFRLLTDRLLDVHLDGSAR